MEESTTIKPTKVDQNSKLVKIPKGWKLKNLDEIGIFFKGKGISKSDVLEPNNEGYSGVRYAEIYTKYHYYTDDFHSKINQESANNSNEIITGDILFAGSGETLEDIGKSIAYLGSKKAYAGGDIIVFRQKNQDSKYLGYLLNNDFVRAQLHKLGQGHSVVHIYAKSLKKLKVLIPPIAEQQKIASILNTWDKAIVAQEKLITEKQVLKKVLMRQLLNGKKRFPGYTKDWKILLLNEISWFQEGPGLRKWQFTTEGIKVINITNLKHSGNLNLSLTNRHISLEEFKDKYEHFECDAKDIVMASSGNSYCKVSIVKPKDLPLIMNTSVIRFKPLKNCDYNFLLNLLKSEKFKREIDRMITGGAQPNFGPYHLNRIKIKIPSIEEQAKISSILKSNDNDISKSIMKLESLKLQKKGLMQQLLTGEKRVKIS
jgi:type I restriction enzyme S subunit